MCENCNLEARIEQQAAKFLYELDYPEFITKYKEHRAQIHDHLNQLPAPFIENPEIFQAALIAATVQTTQERRAGGWTFQEHVLKVSETAHDEAHVMRQNGEAINPDTCAILGLLHDTIEDAGKNGLNSEEVRDLILNTFGIEIYQQVNLLTMQLENEPTDKSTRDDQRTGKWLERIPEMRAETQLVKLADIYCNLDGESLRPSLKKQRVQITERLDIRSRLRGVTSQRLAAA